MTEQVPGLDERLARLAARRSGAFAPPSPHTSARATAAPVIPPPPAPGRSSTPGGIAGTAPAGNRATRRHAAKGSRRAALAMSVTTTIGLTAYFAQIDSSAATNASSTASVATTAQAVTTQATTQTTTQASTAANTAATTAAQASATPSTAAATTAAAGTALADGTYTGATDTNRWGPVQVQVTISGGKITAVTALQTPTGGKSDRINQQAVPILTSEALSAQSAQIDTVSGATYTSNSYTISLQSALDQAATAAAQGQAAAA